MKSLDLSLSLLILLGGIACSAGVSSRGVVQQLEGEVSHLPKPDQLQDGVEEVLVAQRECDFPPHVRALIPGGIDGRGSWDDIENECLGVLEIIDWTTESESVVAIHLLRGSEGARRGLYFIFASFHQGDWTFSWPAAAGPELHPG